jgi:hypothetical protein
MRVARHLMAACLFVLGTAASFAAPEQPENLAVDSTPVAAPQWRVGSTWEYSDGYGLRVASNAASATVFQRLDAPDQWFSMRGFLRQDAVSATAKRQTIYRTVPPSAGDGLTAGPPLMFQQEYLSNDHLIVHASSWAVEGRQRITVPAGTFECWVIVWRARSLKSNWTGFERWWYSPEVQQYVRLEYKYGGSATASRVLMRYHLGDAGESSPDSVGPTAAKSASSTDPGQALAPRAEAASATKLVAVKAEIPAALPPAALAEPDSVSGEQPVSEDSSASAVIPLPKPKVVASAQAPRVKAKQRKTSTRR